MNKKYLIYIALAAALGAYPIKAAEIPSAGPEGGLPDPLSTGNPVLQSILNARQQQDQSDREESAKAIAESKQTAEQEIRQDELNEEINHLQEKLNFSEFLLRLRTAPVLIGEIKENEVSNAFPNVSPEDPSSETEQDSEQEDLTETEYETETETEYEQETLSGDQTENMERDGETFPDNTDEASSESETEKDDLNSESQALEKESAEEEKPSEKDVSSDPELKSDKDSSSDPELQSEEADRSDPELQSEADNSSDPGKQTGNIDLPAPEGQAEEINLPDIEAQSELLAALMAETELSSEIESEESSEAGLPSDSDTIPEQSQDLDKENTFMPVEMGSGINTALPAEDSLNSDGADSDNENSSEPEGVRDPGAEEGEGTDTEAAASEKSSGDIRPRHAAIAIPPIQNMNSARVCLYDYRMLRTYPLAVLPKDMHILYHHLQNMVEEYAGTWSVYVGNLSTGQALIVGDRPMKSASVMKLFIMATVYEQIDLGNIVRDEETVSLLEDMITFSSNEAANRLLLKLGNGSYAEGIDKVNQFIHMHGFSEGTHEYNGFQDSASYADPSHFNQIMAKDIGLLLSKIYYREFISRAVCNEIETMMLNQQTRYKIPKGLPEGVQVGNKTGEMDTVQNDAAVVYGKDVDFVIVILSMDLVDKENAYQNIHEIASTVYSFFED